MKEIVVGKTKQIDVGSGNLGFGDPTDGYRYYIIVKAKLAEKLEKGDVITWKSDGAGNPSNLTGTLVKTTGEELPVSGIWEHRVRPVLNIVRC